MKFSFFLDKSKADMTQTTLYQIMTMGKYKPIKKLMLQHKCL